MLGHGACMLFVNSVLTFNQVEPIVTSGLARLYQSAGDDPDAARGSLHHGWARGLHTGL